MQIEDLNSIKETLKNFEDHKQFPVQDVYFESENHYLASMS